MRGKTWPGGEMIGGEHYIYIFHILDAEEAVVKETVFGYTEALCVREQVYEGLVSRHDWT